MASIGISEDELWEFRNSVVHMSNLSSRKVLSGKVDRLEMCIGDPKILPPRNGVKRFSFTELLHVIADGVALWAQSYDTDTEKRMTFVERYDLSISDSRMLTVRTH